MFTVWLICVYLPTPTHGQDVTLGHFLAEFYGCEFSFLSILFALQKLKNPVSPTIYP